MSMLARATLPTLSHFSGSDFERIYEPSDDTYLLVDVLAADAHRLQRQRPAVCVEVGSGSGCVITSLAQILNQPREAGSAPSPALCLATDINAYAATATVRTAAVNGVVVEAVLMDLAAALRPGCVDVLIFNPPYVPTSEDEMREAAETGDISAAWAGGPRGRLVVDRLLPTLSAMLSDKGLFYLLGVRENVPDELISTLASNGLSATVVAERRAQNERLFVIRASRDVAVRGSS